MVFVDFDLLSCFLWFFFFFFFNDTATTEIYTLSLHDALPICRRPKWRPSRPPTSRPCRPPTDRKSTRLNSSHTVISYAVFCLKKKKKTIRLSIQEIKTRKNKYTFNRVTSM